MDLIVKSLQETWNESTLRSISAFLGEPESLLNLRLTALSRLKNTPWPSAIDESWRRNDPRVIGRDRFAVATPHQDPDDSIAREWEFPDPLFRASILDLYNGVQTRADLLAEHRSSGLKAGSLAQGFQSDSRDALARLAQDIADDKDSPAVSLLQLAFWQGGAYLTVPANFDSRDPILIRHSAAGAGKAIFCRNIIHLGRGARLDVVLDQAAPDESLFWLAAHTRLILNEGSELRLLAINRSSAETRFYDHLSARLGKDAKLKLHWGDLTDGWAVVRREVELEGTGSEAMMRGAFIGTGGARLDLRTLQRHPTPSTSSDLMFRSALFGSSKSIYQGLIVVEPTAPLTNAYQLNRNLLMSPDARADSIPKLEIEVDEVRCTHGASAGKPDSAAMFYLRSRGLSEAEATKLIVEGFIAESGESIENSDLKNYWRDAVIGRADRVLGV